MVVRARSIESVPEESMWQKSRLDILKGCPAAPTGTIDIKNPTEGRVDKMKPEEIPEPETDETRPNRVMIMKKDLEKFGFTPHCPKCRAIERGWGPAMKHGSHS